MSLEPHVQLIREGEPVAPGTPNRPLAQLDQNLRYLWDVIQAATMGSTLYARQVTIEDDALVGMPVYYNTTRQRFERALAGMEITAGIVTPAAACQVWGVVSLKHHATLADLLLCGYAELDLDEAVQGDVVAGTYYLSGVQPGILLTQPAPVSVPILRADGNGRVLVLPRIVDALDSHRHYRFALACRPAGDHAPPAPGQRHVITNPDDSLPGWLPADHASFAGRAPAGAAFGYNLAAEPNLQAAWPPLPLAHAYLEWDKGLDPAQGFHGVPLGPAGLAVLDRYGIWWLSDCYGDVPWPADYGGDVSESNSVLECPRYTEMALTVWFTKLNLADEATVVTNLTSLDERLKIYCAGTLEEASAGALEIDLDLSLTLGDNDRAGYLVMKELDEDGTIHRGPAVTGLYAGSANVVLSSDFTSKLDPDDPASEDIYHGAVSIAVLPEQTRELKMMLIRLMGATEESVPVLHIALSESNPSKFVAMFEVPQDAPAGALFTYQARLLGRAAGTLPQLSFTKARVPRPADGLDTPVAVGGTASALTCLTVATLTDTNQVVEAQSEAFAVDPGDLVFITVERGDDAYAAEVGFLQQIGLLTSS